MDIPSIDYTLITPKRRPRAVWPAWTHEVICVGALLALLLWGRL